MKMKKAIALLLICASPNLSLAGFISSQDIRIIRVINNGSVHLGTAWGSDIGNVCSFYGYQFLFDASTEGGKNMLSTLLSAKMAGRKVNIWYNESTQPDTDQTNGCTTGTMAIANAIGIAG